MSTCIQLIQSLIHEVIGTCQKQDIQRERERKWNERKKKIRDKTN